MRPLAMSGTHKTTARRGTRSAPHPRPREEDEEDEDHRADEERGEVLMREVGAAEGAALGEDGEDGESEERGVDPFPPLAPPQQHQDGQADDERVEDVAEVLVEKKVGEGVEVEVLAAECRGDVGEGERPDGVDDFWDRDERGFEEGFEGAAAGEIDDEGGRAEKDAECKCGTGGRGAVHDASTSLGIPCSY